MRVTAIETIHVAAYPNITFVEVHTDEGLSGLGETFRTPKAIAAQIHETVAPYRTRCSRRWCGPITRAGTRTS
jgi:L-alanine-DL-glutamate epimerase-like enolase superfamily enzyme